MKYNCMNILQWTEAQLKYTHDVSLQEATPQELHEALGVAVMMAISDNWSKAKKTRMHQRKAYYMKIIQLFSADYTYYYRYNGGYSAECRDGGHLQF